MPRVVALYRYPLKGFTPEKCDTLTVLSEGRIAGDRVLGIRFVDTEAPADAWRVFPLTLHCASEYACLSDSIKEERMNDGRSESCLPS